jgi:hypothetical protein
MTHHTLDAKDHDGSMSHLGQKPRFDAPPTASGLPQSTDIIRPAQLIRFGANSGHRRVGILSRDRSYGSWSGETAVSSPQLRHQHSEPENEEASGK